MQDYEQQKRANDSSVTKVDNMAERNSAENAGIDLSCSAETSNRTMPTNPTDDRLSIDQEMTSDNPDAPNNPELQITSASADAASAQRKTWYARLRDKLEKRDKETAAEQKDEVPDKRSRVEPPASTAPTPPKPPTRRPSGGHKKTKTKSLQHHLGAGADGSGFGGGMLGGAGPRPNQGKSTAYHLTPSLLEDVLNEKKMSLMRSPEVMDHLQILQRNVSINRLLGTAPPVVKTEEGNGSAQVKVEDSASNDGKSSSTVATIGEVMMVTIKKEGESDENSFKKIIQNETAKALSDTGTEPVIGGASETWNRGASTINLSDTHGARDSQTSVPSSDNVMNHPLDLTAHRNDAS